MLKKNPKEHLSDTWSICEQRGGRGGVEVEGGHSNYELRHAIGRRCNSKQNDT